MTVNQGGTAEQRLVPRKSRDGWCFFYYIGKFLLRKFVIPKKHPVHINVAAAAILPIIN